MKTLFVIWLLTLIGCVYTKGNFILVFSFGWMSALIYCGHHFVTTYDFTQK